MTELRDQSAHFGAAFLIVALANVMGASIGLIAGAFIALCCGLIREVTEEGEVSLAALRRALGSRLDLTFWTLGGLCAGLLESI